MFETIKWDGAFPIDHEPIIKTALLSYINAEEKERALTTSYGDLGKILKKIMEAVFMAALTANVLSRATLKV